MGKAAADRFDYRSLACIRAYQFFKLPFGFQILSGHCSAKLRVSFLKCFGCDQVILRAVGQAGNCLSYASEEFINFLVFIIPMADEPKQNMCRPPKKHEKTGEIGPTRKSPYLNYHGHQLEHPGAPCRSSYCTGSVVQ